MKKRYHFVLYLSLLMLSHVTVAQSFFGQALNKPSKYNHPSEKTSFENTNERDQNQIWVVYSDRDGNISYADSINKIVFKSFNFMSEFYVVDESQNRIHIVKDKDYISEYGFSNQAIDYGWVFKENLLLWNHCLYGRTTHSEGKCFILNNGASFDDTDLGIFYKDPNILRGTEEKINAFSLFYIYKIIEDAVLIGSKPGINAYGQLMLAGWVPISQIIIWKGRSAIEPNFDTIATFERRQNNIKATLCNSMANAKRLAEGKYLNNDSIVWNNDPYEIKWKMNHMRFPVIDYNSNKEIVEAVVYHSKNGSEISVMTSKAFAPLMVDGLQNPLFTKVVYLTKDEVDDLKFIYNSFQSIASTSNPRSDIKWFLIGLLENRFDETSKQKDFENYTFRELSNIIYYLPAPYGIQSAVIEDLTDSSVISGEHFSTYHDKLNSQINNMGVIVNYIESEVGLQFQENNFFWVPEKFFK